MCKLTWVSNWRNLVVTSPEPQPHPIIQTNRRKIPEIFDLWSSLLVWKGGHDCSSKEVTTRLRQFENHANLHTFTLAVIQQYVVQQWLQMVCWTWWARKKYSALKLDHWAFSSNLVLTLWENVSSGNVNEVCTMSAVVEYDVNNSCSHSL
jgi:hypothetical protein